METGPLSSRAAVRGNEVFAMTCFDAHSDLLYDVTRRSLAGETRVLETHHLDRLRRGGVEGLVLACWYGAGDGHTFWKDVPGAGSDAARLRIMADCARAELAQCREIRLVRTVKEAEEARAAGQIYAFLGIEGMAAFDGDADGIDRFYELGGRLGMLTWNEANAFAAGAGADPEKGLTDRGRAAVRRMEDLGMVVDVSHLSDGGFWDVMDMAAGPVIASHSNCRALCDVRRNLTDDQLRAIRDSGGVVGLNVYHSFVHADPARQTAETLALHAARMAEVMGIEHVGCGFDFCEFFGPPDNDGAAGLEDASRIGNLFCALEKLGMSRRERALIARENFLRVFRQVLG